MLKTHICLIKLCYSFYILFLTFKKRKNYLIRIIWPIITSFLSKKRLKVKLLCGKVLKIAIQIMTKSFRLSLIINTFLFNTLMLILYSFVINVIVYKTKILYHRLIL